MSKLSAVPKVIVKAMQIALISLVLTAAVPLATGGLSISDGSAGITYGGNTMSVDVKANIGTDLYFDVTNFRCDVRVSSGDCVVTFAGPGATIARNGNTPLDISAEISLIDLMVIMLFGASDGDAELTVTMDLRGSTLAGMLSLRSSVDIVVACITAGNVEISDDGCELTAEFVILKNGLFDIIIDDIMNEFDAGGKMRISAGDLTFTVKMEDTADGHSVFAEIVSSAGTLADAIGDLMNSVPTDADGHYMIEYNGVGSLLTEKDMERLIDMLTSLCGVCS